MNKITISRYLFTRLSQLGVGSLHGVPGDFNLRSLDELGKSGLKWVGNCNELNAGYAADGYARIKSIGALATTFGVGELSAINAIAGAYAEHVPVVQIVGQPSTQAQKSKGILHHTLGDGNFNVFSQMHSMISAAQTVLDNPATASREIDRVLTECWIKSQPVYIGLPSDMSVAEIVGDQLQIPLQLDRPRSSADLENFVVDSISRKLYAAKNPVLLIDAGASRHRLLKEVEQLVIKSNIPTITAPMGKSCVNETLPNYQGCYDGSESDLTNLVKSSDLVLSIGAVRSDINTLGFSARINPENEIQLQSDHVDFGFARYGVSMEWILKRLLKELDFSRLRCQLPQVLPVIAPSQLERAPSTFQNKSYHSAITHDYFWPRLSSWLRPKDIILNSSGTSNLGIWATRLPPNVQAITQILWSSIGYTLAATQGAALAAKELGNNQRVILFEGDGAFQMTAQEISTMLKHDLRPIIFVLDNDGYATERWINGWDADYNDVAKWDYASLPKIFSTKEGQAKTYKVKTKEELEALLSDKSFNDAKCLQLVEMKMPRDDAPRTLKLLAEQVVIANSKQ